MLNNSFINSSRVREEARSSMANSLSTEEMLLEVRFPNPKSPFSQDPGIPVDLQEGSGMAEFVANLLSPDTLLGLEINQGNGSNATDSMLDESSSGECASNDCRHHTYDTLKTQLRGGGEVLLLIWSVIYLLGAAHEASFLGRKIFLDNMVMCPSRVIFLTGCFTFVLMLPARLLCFPTLEDRLALVVMLSHGPYFLFFCRGFRLVGPMVIMIYRMLTQDLARFFTVFIIFIMGFSQAFYIIFQSFKVDGSVEDVEEIIDEDTGEILCDDDNENCVMNPMKGVAESMIMTFLMSVGELSPCWDALQYSNHEYIGKIHWGLFVMIVFLLLLNLLIAMMGDTYAKIAAIKNEWMRQWAKTLLITERGIPPKERLRQQDLYADRDSAGDKALVMKQFLSDEKVEEINEIIEMKMTHRKNIERRKAKFGFESDSKMGLNMVGAAVVVPDASDGTEPENPYDDAGDNVAVNPAFMD